jgi:hypothetical protein
MKLCMDSGWTIATIIRSFGDLDLRLFLPYESVIRAIKRLHFTRAADPSSITVLGIDGLCISGFAKRSKE